MTPEYAAALERARAEGIRVAPLGDAGWLAQSSEPHLRGPYLVLFEEDGTGHCECLAGRFREPCKHRAAALAAAEGQFAISDASTILGPGDFARAPDRAGHIYAPPRHVAAKVAEHEAERAAKRATAPPVTPRDYQDLFPD